MFGLGLPEIAIILIGVAVLFFGAKKIREIAYSVGKISGEYKKGKMEIEKELKELAEEDFQEKKSEKK